MSIALRTGLCSAFYGGCKRDTARVCCRAPCCAAAPLLLGARRLPLSIDIPCPPGAQQQTRRLLLQRSVDGTDR